MYFKKFPKILYEYGYNDKGEPQYKLMSDITRNIRFRRDILSNVTLYDEYDIRDGETPEILAEKFYDNATYHWIIMLANDRFDYIKDFPLAYPDLVKYVEDTYGVSNVYGTHHYENSKGLVVNYDEPGAYAVSNMEYEERINESKRRIKIISRDIISKLLSQFNQLV